MAWSKTTFFALTAAAGVSMGGDSLSVRMLPITAAASWSLASTKCV